MNTQSELLLLIELLNAQLKLNHKDGRIVEIHVTEPSFNFIRRELKNDEEIIRRVNDLRFAALDIHFVLREKDYLWFDPWKDFPKFLDDKL